MRYLQTPAGMTPLAEAMQRYLQTPGGMMSLADPTLADIDLTAPDDSSIDKFYSNVQSFSRASISTVKDCHGLLNTIGNNEIPWHGAMRVKNLASGNNTQNITVVAGREYHVTIGVCSGSVVCSGAFTGTLTGDSTHRIGFANGDVKLAASTTLTLTVSGVVADIQVEDVTGPPTTQKVPGPYVAPNVVHNSNVAGVKCFPFDRSHITVDANGVVSEVGTKVYHPVAYESQGAGTNIVFPSGIYLYNAAKPGQEIATPVTDIVGGQSAKQFTVSATGFCSGDVGVNVAVTPGAVMTFSYFMKGMPSTPNANNSIYNKSANTWIPAIGSQEPAAFGYTKYIRKFTVTTNCTQLACLWWYTSLPAGTVVTVCNPQLEASAFPTAIIPSVTSATSRASPSMLLKPGLLTDAEGALGVEMEMLYASADKPTGAGDYQIIGSSATTREIYDHDTSGAFGCYDATNLSTVSKPHASGDVMQFALSWGNVAKSFSGRIGAGTWTNSTAGLVYDGSFNPDGVGVRVGGSRYPFRLRKFKTWKNRDIAKVKVSI